MILFLKLSRRIKCYPPENPPLKSIHGSSNYS